MEPQQAFVHPWPQVDADRAHVAHELLRRFLEQKIQAAFAPRGTPRRQSARRGWSCLCPPCRRPARAPAEVPFAAEHLVQLGNAARDALDDAWCSRPSEVTGSTLMPLASMRNGILVRAVVRAAILDDSQAAGRDLLADAVIEQDHGIGDVFLETLRGSAPLRRVRP